EKVRPRKTEKEKRRVQLLQKLLEQREERFFGPVQVLEHDRPRRRTKPGLEVSRHPKGEVAPARVGRQLRLRRVGIGESEGRELARDGPRLEVVEALHPRDARLDL